MILYFLQISTSEKKESTALIQGPPPLVSKIRERVDSTWELPIDVRFVLVSPSDDVSDRGTHRTWTLPTPEILEFKYKAYWYKLVIPDGTGSVFICQE